MSQVTNDQFEINGKVYTLSSLRLKHLKQISKLVTAAPEGNLIDKLNRWWPFIEFSIKEKHSDFNLSELDELSLNELLELWTKVQEVSGITVGAKGETQPKAATGPISTDVSALPSAGTTVQ